MKDKTRNWLIKYGIPMLYVAVYVGSTLSFLLIGTAFIRWYYCG